MAHTDSDNELNTIKKRNIKKTRRRPFYKKVWFWLATGGAVLLLIGGGLTVFLLTRNSYEKIYNEYSQTLETKGDQLLKDFEEKADKNNAGSEGLDKIYNESVDELNKIINQGTDEMDNLKLSQGDDSILERDKWSDKLTDLGKDKIDDITDAYTSHEDYQKYSDNEKKAKLDSLIDETNSGEPAYLIVHDLKTNSDGTTTVNFLFNFDPEKTQVDLNDLEESVEGINELLITQSKDFIDRPKFSYYIKNVNQENKLAEYTPDEGFQFLLDN